VVPGTKMLFGGIADAKTRADLIAYLAEATAVTPKADAAPQ
jgi:cytochrome c2